MDALDKGGYECVLTCGFAGGLNPDLAPSTVVCSAEVGSPALEARLARAQMVPARFACSDRVLVTAREKAELRRVTGADAVEMESGHIRDICRRRGVPCATIRVVLDSATEDLPLNFNALMDADMKVSPLRIAAEVARRPRLVPKLLRLSGESARAACVLAEALLKITAQPVGRH